jgi:histidine ammonia-lyase
VAAIQLTGHDLTVDDVEAVALHGAAVELSPEALDQIEASRALIERVVREQRPTYGVNTGFGKLVDVHIDSAQAAELQLNLLRSHACGVGEPFPDEVVRAAILLRANALAKGTSGVRRELVQLLADLLGSGVLPVVPSRGSLGASGDLAPLAHLALVLVGEGRARVGSELVGGADALARAGLAPIELAAKEGLSLINGTQFMAAIGALVVCRARRLAKLADLAAAQTIEAVRGSRTPFSPELQALRPHPGQEASAANLYALLDDSQIVASHRWCGRVQDAYSLRCSPQVHGAVRDALAYAERAVAVEVNAATDNPLVLAERAEVVSNGNFHGEPVAIPLDALKIGLAELGTISERRIERMLNPTMSNGLPPFLAHESGLNSGFMITQYVAASLVAENRVLAHPASVDSIPTSAGQEDHVSMGATSAVHLWQVCANAERILAVELLCGAQGLDFLEPLRPGPAVSVLHRALRRRSPRLEHDRSLAAEIDLVAAAVRDGSLLAEVEAAAGGLR